MAPTKNAAAPTLRVWDLPTRVFHWALVMGVVAMVVTGNLEDDAALGWHFQIGYVIASLLLFRLVWGIFGGYWSRFGNFRWSLAPLGAQAGNAAEAAHPLGHSRTGSWAVVGLLGAVALQVTTGLFSDDDISMSGPFSHWVDSALVSTLTWVHKDVSKVVLIVLVALHIGAIAYYAFRRRQNLVPAMLHGDVPVRDGGVSSEDRAKNRLSALIIWLFCYGLIRGVVVYAGG